MYLFSGFGLSYINVFVIVTLLSALDFWTVKNVSGRLLVGLRWSNFVEDDGTSRWHFQSFEEGRFIHPTDSNIFWLGLFVPAGVWVLLAFGAILTFKLMWMLLILVALSLNMINVVGYVKCKRGADKKLTALGGSLAAKGLSFMAQARMGQQQGAVASGGQPEPV